MTAVQAAVILEIRQRLSKAIEEMKLLADGIDRSHIMPGRKLAAGWRLEHAAQHAQHAQDALDLEAEEAETVIGGCEEVRA